MIGRTVLLLTIVLSFACINQMNIKESRAATESVGQQTLYYGGDIITMEGDKPAYLEAVIERNGRVIYVGDRAGAVNNFAGETIEVDLKGKTMLPGFFDSHGSYMSGALFDEKMIGMIRKGMPADFVILDKNPLKVNDVNAIGEITVIETIKAGKTIYKKKIVEKLSGYFVKNTVKFDDNYDFKHVVVTNQKDFDKYFGVAKTMNNKIDKVNFSENSVIAIMIKPAKVSRKIELIYYEFEAGKLLVKYHIREGSENTYESTALYLATIPKGVASVKFKSRYNVGVVDIK